jgi:hypothetical protein
MTDPDTDLLRRLRAPFPAEVIGLLPKPTKKNVPDSEKSKCPDCQAYIGPHIHLSYIGWAAVVDRILEHDALWQWEPFALDEDGLPKFRESPNGLEVEFWLRLTIAGVTRIGVGIVGKDQDDLAKKLLSDAIKNAANKFGIALYLWSKDELESLIGNEAVTTRRRAPRSSTPTGSRSPRTPSRTAPATDPATEGLTGLSAKDRNKILGHLSRLDPPVRGDASVNAHLTAILDLPEPLESIVKLTEAQGTQVMEYLGIDP